MNEEAKMASYAVCGSTLASSVPLPELLPHGSEDPELVFRLLPASQGSPDDHPWYHHTLNNDGSRWLSMTRAGSGYFLRFPDLADFTLSEDARQIGCRPVGGTPDETIRHLLLDQVVPLALGHRGGLVLHAGAVTDGSLGVAFVGEAGWGKSTITAAFCRMGWSLLADDCLPICDEGRIFLAKSSYPGIRLWPDALRALFGQASGERPVAHYSAKRRVGAGSMVLGMSSRKVPLRAVYLLDPSEPRDSEQEICFTSIPPHEALLVFLKYLFRLDTTDRARLGQEFERLTRLAESVPIRRLSFHRDLEALPSLVASIGRDALRLAESASGPQPGSAPRRDQISMNTGKRSVPSVASMTGQ